MWLQQLSPGGLGQADQRGRGGEWDSLFFTSQRGPCLKGRCFRSPGMCRAGLAVYLLSCKGR